MGMVMVVWMIMVVRMGMLVIGGSSLGKLSFRSQDVYFGRVDAAAINAAQIQLGVEIERSNGVPKHLEGNARIDESAQ